MQKPELFDIYGLEPVENVCNQILREIITLPSVSMAHVIMEKDNVSLYHKHNDMSEVYFILKGEGILYYGDRGLFVKEDSYLIIPKDIPHKLKNTGDSELEHLVFAAPPFDPDDIEMVDEPSSYDIDDEISDYKKNPVEALDGATVYEMMSKAERTELDFALALGILPKQRKAKMHYHNVSEELYYIISGYGKVVVGDKRSDIKKGSLVYVPTDHNHALENKSDSEELKALCLSSPPYAKEDFILI